MARIVQKFGGTSVADIERIKNAAQLAKMEYDAGHQVVVVVSAMAGVTNQLVDYVNEIDNTFDPGNRVRTVADKDNGMKSIPG